MLLVSHVVDGVFFADWVNGSSSSLVSASVKNQNRSSMIQRYDLIQVTRSTPF